MTLRVPHKSREYVRPNAPCCSSLVVTDQHNIIRKATNETHCGAAFLLFSCSLISFSSSLFSMLIWFSRLLVGIVTVFFFFWFLVSFFFSPLFFLLCQFPSVCVCVSPLFCAFALTFTTCTAHQPVGVNENRYRYRAGTVVHKPERDAMAGRPQVRVLVQDSDDDEWNDGSCQSREPSIQRSPNPRRPVRTTQKPSGSRSEEVGTSVKSGSETAASIFSSRAAACAELLLKRQACATTPKERLGLLHRVGNLGGPYRECVKGSATRHAMWLRYVEFNQDVIAETERFLSAQGHGLLPPPPSPKGRSTPRHHVKPLYTLCPSATPVVGCYLPLPDSRPNRALSSTRSVTPAATAQYTDETSAGTYELSQGERCALSLFAMQAEAPTRGASPEPRTCLGTKRFRGVTGTSDMAPSTIYEGSSFTTAIQSIDRIQKPRSGMASFLIESSTVDATCSAPSLSGTVIETQIAKSQREWLEWCRAATLCPY